MDIRGLGDRLVEQLVDKGIVRTVSDLYRLAPAPLAGLERMGQKSAENLISAVAVSKERPFSRLLAALGIRFVGARGAEILAEAFPGCADPQQGSRRGPGVGGGHRTRHGGVHPVFFAREQNRKLLEELAQLGVRGALPAAEEQPGEQGPGSSRACALFSPESWNP